MAQSHGHDSCGDISDESEPYPFYRRLNLVIGPNGPYVESGTQIASGYMHQCDPVTFVDAPTGLVYNPKRDELYVASTVDNKIFAVHDAADILLQSHMLQYCSPARYEPYSGCLDPSLNPSAPQRVAVSAPAGRRDEEQPPAPQPTVRLVCVPVSKTHNRPLPTERIQWIPGRRHVHRKLRS